MEKWRKKKLIDTQCSNWQGFLEAHLNLLFFDCGQSKLLRQVHGIKYKLEDILACLKM